MSWATENWSKEFSSSLVKKFAFVLANVGVLSLGMWLSVRFERPAQFLAGSVGAIAIMSFVTFYQRDQQESSTEAMRRAIAGSVILLWIVFFGLVIFSPTLQGVSGGSYSQTETGQRNTTVQQIGTLDEAANSLAQSSDDLGRARDEIPVQTADELEDAAQTLEEAGERLAAPKPVARQLLDDFSKVLIFVVTFYFGGQTAVAVAEKLTQRKTARG